MEVLQATVDREFTAVEILGMIRDRVGHGSRTRFYKWMPQLGITPRRYYSQKDAAKLLWFAAVLKKKRSVVIARKTVLYYLETIGEEEFIRQAFNYR